MGRHHALIDKIPQTAQSIDEVIIILNDIINEALAKKSRMGYFPALYRRVTMQVKEGIENGIFDDGPRMEQLDLIFANRYFEAFAQHQNENNCTECWKLTFASTTDFWPLVLQHLLLAMNAHINLDLGIATASLATSETLPLLKQDFNRINDILSSQIDTIENELSSIWPFFRYFDKLFGKNDEKLAAFSMRLARKEAWNSAMNLSALNKNERELFIKTQDEKITKLGHKILNPGIVPGLFLKLLRLGEVESTDKVIEILVS